MGVKPSKANLEAVVSPAVESLEALRKVLPEDQHHLLIPLESYIAVTARVLAGTNPSKIRDAARTVWIKGLMDHKEGLES